MILYLLRHGAAAPGARSPEPALTPRGQEDVRAVADVLARRAEPRPFEIRHSRRLRAFQTAMIVGERLSAMDRLREVDGISPEDREEELAAELSFLSGDLLVVSHLPFVDRLTSRLLLGPRGGDILCFPTAGLAALEREPRPTGEPGWRLLFFVTPSCLR